MYIVDYLFNICEKSMHKSYLEKKESCIYHFMNPCGFFYPEIILTPFLFRERKKLDFGYLENLRKE